jgi:hypothetical protein
LTLFIDAVADYLRKDLSPVPALVGSSEPDGVPQLPAVALSVVNVTSPHPGIGAVPRDEARGALAMTTRVDLARPYLDYPGERVALLTAEGGNPERPILQLPHGAIVRHDGTQQLPFTGQDLTVAVGGRNPPRLTVVGAPPGPNDVRPDPITGQLHFGAALPAKGALVVTYFVGSWSVRSERLAGDLQIDVFARDAAGADALSRGCEASLAPDRSRRIAGLRSLAATGWGTLGALDALSRRRSLTYRFDYEHEEPVVLSGGGPIRRLHVTSSLGPVHGPPDQTDQFDVTRRESSK